MLEGNKHEISFSVAKITNLELLGTRTNDYNETKFQITLNLKTAVNLLFVQAQSQIMIRR